MYGLISQSLKNMHYNITPKKQQNFPDNKNSLTSNNNINNISIKGKNLNFQTNEKLHKNIPEIYNSDTKKNIKNFKVFTAQNHYAPQKSVRINSFNISSNSSKKNAKEEKNFCKNHKQLKGSIARPLRRISILRRMISTPMQYDKLIEIRKKINQRFKDTYVNCYFKINYNASYIKDMTNRLLIFDYYQINNLIFNKKCHLKSKLDDYHLFYNNGQEYLIKYYN